MKAMLLNKNSKAFTLLEVILALTILSTMALISTQALTRALRARTKIQAEVDDISALRDSLRMIRSDINLAFHHRDFEKELSSFYNDPVLWSRSYGVFSSGGASLTVLKNYIKSQDRPL